LSAQSPVPGLGARGGMHRGSGVVGARTVGATNEIAAGPVHLGVVARPLLRMSALGRPKWDPLWASAVRGATNSFFTMENERGPRAAWTNIAHRGRPKIRFMLSDRVDQSGDSILTFQMTRPASFGRAASAKKLRVLEVSRASFVVMMICARGSPRRRRFRAGRRQVRFPSVLSPGAHHFPRPRERRKLTETRNAAEETSKCKAGPRDGAPRPAPERRQDTGTKPAAALTAPLQARTPGR
jgi:hypothetical protein